MLIIETLLINLSSAQRYFPPRLSIHVAFHQSVSLSLETAQFKESLKCLMKDIKVQSFTWEYGCWRLLQWQCFIYDLFFYFFCFFTLLYCEPYKKLSDYFYKTKLLKRNSEYHLTCNCIPNPLNHLWGILLLIRASLEQRQQPWNSQKCMDR